MNAVLVESNRVVYGVGGGHEELRRRLCDLAHTHDSTFGDDGHGSQPTKQLNAHTKTSAETCPKQLPIP